MSKRLLLFSSGQDSSFIFIYLLVQQEKKDVFLLTTNHETQMNSFRNLTHSLFLSYMFQEKHLFLFLKSRDNYLSEDGSRFFRYLGVVRLRNFYSILLFLTGHSQSDLLETYFLNWSRKFFSFQKLFSFQSKILIQKTYHQNTKKNLIKPSFKKGFLKKFKKTSNFLCTFSTNNKSNIFFTRPLKFFSRQALQFTALKIPLYLFVDVTNFDFFISRNKIRRHLFLYLDWFLYQDTRYSSISHPKSLKFFLHSHIYYSYYFGDNFFYLEDSFESKTSYYFFDFFFLAQFFQNWKIFRLRILTDRNSIFLLSCLTNYFIIVKRGENH